MESKLMEQKALLLSDHQEQIVLHIERTAAKHLAWTKKVTNDEDDPFVDMTPIQYLRNLLVYAFVDGPELLAPSTLKGAWQPNFESFLRRRYDDAQVPSQKDIINDRSIKDVYRVLKNIAADYNVTSSANPMFLRDAIRLCNTTGFSTRDLCDKLAVMMLSQYGTRFSDLQRYLVRDFRLHTTPQQVRMISTKNGSQFYSWVLLPPHIAALATTFIQRARLKAHDYVFCYAYREKDNAASLQGSLKYLDMGRSTFAKTLDSMGRSAGYPRGYFSGHSGGHGLVTEYVIRACCQGRPIRDALDQVCAETGRWRIGSQAILRYIAPTVGRVMSMIPPGPPEQRLAAFESMDLATLHDIELSTPYQRMSCTKWNGDLDLIRSVTASILKGPINTLEAVKDICQRSATIIIQQFGHDHPFVEWCREQALAESTSGNKSTDSLTRVWMGRIIPTLIVSYYLTSSYPGQVEIKWPLPEYVKQYLLLPTLSSVRQGKKPIQGERKTAPEVRGNENTLTRDSLKESDARGLLSTYLQKRKNVKHVVRIREIDANSGQAREVVRKPKKLFRHSKQPVVLGDDK